MDSIFVAWELVFNVSSCEKGGFEEGSFGEELVTKIAFWV